MTAMTDVDRVLSAKLSGMVHAKDKDCYVNAVQALAASNDPEARYVEGYAIGDLFPMVQPHGWVELRGRIVEVTPVWLAMKTARYFPATRMDLNDCTKHVMANETLPWTIGDFAVPEAHRAVWLDAQRAAWGEQYDEVAKMFGWTEPRTLESDIAEDR